MAQKTVYLRGSVKWVKHKKPDPKFNVWTLDFYPDDPSWDLFDKVELQLQVRTDKEDGKYVKFRRPVVQLRKGEAVELTPPDVTIKQDDAAVPYDGDIGNGTKGLIKIEVYDTLKGKGHRWLGFLIEDLVEYVPNEVLSVDDDIPF